MLPLAASVCLCLAGAVVPRRDPSTPRRLGQSAAGASRMPCALNSGAWSGEACRTETRHANGILIGWVRRYCLEPGVVKPPREEGNSGTRNGISNEDF